jgi:hypothetical protein
VFGIAVARVVFRPGRVREGDLLRKWLARVLSEKWGQDAVLAAGLLLVLAGARECFLAATGRGAARRRFRRLSRIGIAAHGVLLAVIGFFAARAAIDLNPGELVETGGALRALVRLPYGAAWLFAVAAGLIAYGLSLWSRPRA